MHLAAADHHHRGGGGRPGLGLGLGHLASAALRREHRRRALAGGAVLASALLLVATPRLRHSPALHLFADMRNLLGVPNTLNVLTAYPLLLAGVPGLVLCLCGSGCFGISLRWEALGWFLFYAGNVAAAFGSAYYHLKPDDDRLIWDRLPAFTFLQDLKALLTESGTHSQMRRLLRSRAAASRPSHRRHPRLISTAAAGDQPIPHNPPTTSAVPWNRLLRAHLGRSRGDLALALYRHVRALAPAMPNSYTLPLALRAADSPRVASAVHAHALHLGLHGQPDVAGQLLAAYSRLGRTAEARHVFDAMPSGRTTFS
ncbi:hypothetical protein E2562_000602 [Oryza meyeriana var. granulata]|uniref:Uncharacterized protein n=1 Tax=Oryza meyeriana var. granulata TaxID=110450 RepID=A0A6G1DU09_9ORYZ|nr:hypothetical protein E2562_000602 [Oryza meyeriana var. granulata]